MKTYAMIGTISSKPETWTWEEFIRVVKETNMIPGDWKTIDTTTHTEHVRDNAIIKLAGLVFENKLTKKKGSTYYDILMGDDLIAREMIIEILNNKNYD